MGHDNILSRSYPSPDIMCDSSKPLLYAMGSQSHIDARYSHDTRGHIHVTDRNRTSCARCHGHCSSAPCTSTQIMQLTRQQSQKSAAEPICKPGTHHEQTKTAAAGCHAACWEHRFSSLRYADIQEPGDAAGCRIVSSVDSRRPPIKKPA